MRGPVGSLPVMGRPRGAARGVAGTLWLVVTCAVVGSSDWVAAPSRESTSWRVQRYTQVTRQVEACGEDPVVVESRRLVRDSPSMQSFTWTPQMQKDCHAPGEWDADLVKRVVAGLPFNLDRDRFNAHDMFLSQESKVVDIFSGVWDEMIKLLPNSTDNVFQKRRYGSCAIVGNSGNLMMSHYGDEIDGHDAIFRFNAAQTTEFQPHVGTKTTFRVLNRKWSEVYYDGGLRTREHDGFQWHERIPAEEGVTIVMSRILSQDIQAYLQKMQERIEIERWKGVKVTLLNGDFVHWTMAVMEAFRQCQAAHLRLAPDWEAGHTPSTGTSILLGALHFCDHVSVYGSGEELQPHMRYQYYETGASGHSHGRPSLQAHSFSLEQMLLPALADAKLLRFCRTTGCAGKPLRPKLCMDPLSAGNTSAIIKHRYPTRIISGQTITKMGRLN